jgi:hypothetical protein
VLLSQAKFIENKEKLFVLEGINISDENPIRSKHSLQNLS